MNFETKYNEIGNHYNSTRGADPYITDKIFELLQSNSNELNLDIGCGTGNYTHALSKKGLQFIGVDPASKMLDIAKAKNPALNWKIGSAEKIVDEDEKFNNVIATLTLHHWTDLDKAFKEIHRVLKPHGKFVIFTSTPQQMEKYWLNFYFPKMMKKSILQMPSLEQIQEKLAYANFSLVKCDKYFVTNSLEDFFLYSGKERPEIYLQEKFRKGISSFATLASKEEVESGLKTLESHLSDGSFSKIKKRFSANLGDYLFIVAKKGVG